VYAHNNQMAMVEWDYDKEKTQWQLAGYVVNQFSSLTNGIFWLFILGGQLNSSLHISSQWNSKDYLSPPSFHHRNSGDLMISHHDSSLQLEYIV